jgi:hypothetical protein
MEYSTDHKFQYPKVTDISGAHYLRGTLIDPKTSPDLGRDADIFEFKQKAGSEILRHIPEFQTDEIRRELQAEEQDSARANRSRLIPDD